MSIPLWLALVDAEILVKVVDVFMNADVSVNADVEMTEDMLDDAV
jgi:hypothetical protein